MLNELYSTLSILRSLGYDFSVKNERRSADVHYSWRPTPDSKYGYNLADILKKWNFADRDSRFAEFY